MVDNSKEIKTVVFFPWLIIPKPIKIGNIIFVPFNLNGNIHNKLNDIKDIMAKILSSYRNFENEKVTSCVVACNEDINPPWNWANKYFEEIRAAAYFLTLAAFAKNNYFSSFRNYANSSIFTLYNQNFQEKHENITIIKRRRDMPIWDGGYKHGTPLFPIPLPCTNCDVKVDIPFAEALGKAYLDNFPLIGRLIPALQFFNLANTDSELMQEEAEIILMASAFEQLLGTKRARELSCEIGELFKKYGRVSVKDALQSRPGIKLDHQHPEQNQWFVHRKWAEELYDLRSKFVHGELIKNRQWGWSPQEHLVFGAFAFPLVVKLCLAGENRYKLTKEDEGHCISVDFLLKEKDWHLKSESDNNQSKWQEVIFDVRVRGL